MTSPTVSLGLALALATACMLTACGDSPCPEGTREEGAACVPVATDAGTTDASADTADATDPPDATPDTSDGGPDAGPCGVCAGDRPLCNTTTMECVTCLTGAECADMGLATMCSDTGDCVECLGNADCDEPGRSVCATDGLMAGSCVACTVGSADDCAGVMDGERALNVCDDSAGSGVCVECTAATEETDCGDNACDPATQQCTDTVRDTQGVCEACVSDSECQAGLGCVPMTFRGDALPGGYCMTIEVGFCEQPYTTPLVGRTTLSGVSGASYCGINETLARCESVLALVGNAMCPGGEDSECPGDGLCRAVGQSISTGTGGLPNRCTYECSGDDQECPTLANKDTCGTGHMPMPEADSFCGGGRP